MAQIERKWLEDEIINNDKLDSSDSFVIAGLTNTGDSSTSGEARSGSLYVEADATVADGLKVVKDFIVDGESFFDKPALFETDATILRDLFVQGDASIGGAITTSSDATLANLTVEGPFVAQSDATVQGVLDVNSDASFAGNVRVDGSMSIGTGTLLLDGTGLRSSAPFFMDTPRSEMTGDMGFLNNVGIGTTAPSEYDPSARRLVIKDSSNAGMSIASGVAGQGYIFFADGTLGVDRYRGSVSYDHYTNKMYMGTDGSTRLSIDNTGSVGIGTTEPTRALDVVGDVGASQDVSIGRDLVVTRDATVSGDVTLDDLSVGGDLGVGNDLNVTRDTDIGRDLGISRDATVGVNLQAAKASVTGNISAGSVGIGVSTPSVKLYVFDPSSNPVVRIAGGSQADISLQDSSTGDAVRILGTTDDSAGQGKLELFTRQSVAGLGNARLVIDHNGDVGIGATNPTHYNNCVTLTVGGNSSSQRGLLQFKSNYNSGDGAQIWQDSDGLVRFNVNSSLNAMVMDSNGDVGIGTDDPTERLEVKSAGQGPQIQVTASNSDQPIVLFYESGGHDGLLYLRDSSDNNQVRLHTDGDTYFTGGAVGIGTNSPGTTLHADSNTVFNYSRSQSGQDTILITDNSAGIGINKFGPSIGFGAAADDQRSAAIVSVQLAGDDDRVGLAFFTHPAAGSSDDLEEAMRIGMNSYVGIGITNPSSLLHVKASSGACAISIESSDAAKDRWTISSADLAGEALLNITDADNVGRVLTLNGDNGNVGIGTYPQEILHVHDSAPSAIRFTAGSADNYLRSDGTSLTLENTYGSGWLSLKLPNPTTGKIEFKGNNTSHMLIDGATGKVGIGTTPSQKLTVNGSGYFNGNLNITGDLYANNKYFRITHPLDETKWLLHSSTESDKPKLIYDGKSQLSAGKKEISMPEWFVSITIENSCAVILTAIGCFAPLYVMKNPSGVIVEEGRFTVKCDDPNFADVEFYWYLSAERKFEDGLKPIEIDKTEELTV